MESNSRLYIFLTPIFNKHTFTFWLGCSINVNPVWPTTLCPQHISAPCMIEFDTSAVRAKGEFLNNTSDSLDIVPGSSGRLNFFCEPIAAGKGGEENMAATVLIRVIQDCICSAFLLQRKGKAQSGIIRKHKCGYKTTKWLFYQLYLCSTNLLEQLSWIGTIIMFSH